MVLVESISDIAPTNCEVKLEGGGIIRAVAPYKYRRCLVNAEDNDEGFVDSVLCNPKERRRMSAVAASQDETDRWEGVRDFLLALGCAIEIDNEREIFIGKRVFEFGFATGCPSALALKNGAHSVHIHCLDETHLDAYVKPSLERNNCQLSRCKFSTGSYADCLSSLKLLKYHVILAPELLFEQDYEAVHKILDQALLSNGVVFISARSYYDNTDASLQAFLDFLKHKGRFDAFIRWTSPAKGDIRPRKLVQLSRRFL